MTERIHFDHCAIRASAGTGKTYALTSRYIGLLAAGISPANIVATTFSRKAAGEIHERVLKRLSAAVHDDEARAELNKAIGRDLSAVDYAALLVEFVQRTHRVNIATLDAIFIRIASAFGLELHLPPGWTIGRSIDDAAVREDAIAAMLEASPVDRLIDLLRLLNEGEDRASVTRRVDEAVLRMHKLYLDAPLESQWAWLDKPAVPDSAALDSIIDQIADLSIPTTQAGKPRKHWLNNREQIIKALLARDWKGLIGIGLVGRIILGEPEFDRAAITDDAIAVIDPAINVARTMLIRNLAGQNEATYALLHDFDEHHLSLRRRRRLLTFDEVTRTLVLAGLTDKRDRIYYRLDSEVHHLLLDEFQDTSLPQWRVIQPIARELTDTDPGEGRTAFVVGDTKQAIYGWRDGNAEIFRGIGDELPGIGSPQTLAKSWRSSPVVIDLVNQVFTGLIENEALADRAELARSWADDFQPHSTHKQKLEGYAELRVEDDPPARATRQVLDELQRRPHVTIGVLTRSNKMVADIIFRLRAAGVFASEEGGNPLTDSPAVSVVLSLLTLADHPGDSAARFHVQQSPLGPLVGLTDRTTIASFAADLRRRIADAGYGRTVFDWVRRFAPHCDQRNVNRLMQLVELADQFDAQPTVRTRDFVRLVHETRVEDPSSANVRVMTVHQSKGLEFDVVILPELDGQLIGQSPQAISERPTPTSDIDRVSRCPSEMVRSWVPELELMYEQYATGRMNDSLSMLYVALTRAKHAVHMIISPAKKVGCTFAGVLRGALTDGGEVKADQQPLWGIGDANWRHSGETTGVAEEPTVTLAGPGASTHRRRSLPRRSPSEFEGGRQAKLSDMLRINAGGARGRGSIMHRWCELIEWLDEALPDDATLLEAGREITPGFDVPPLIEPWRKMIGQPEIAAALQRDAYDSADLTVERERRFAVMDDDSLLTGAIDRMVIGRRDGQIAFIDVLDFKTDVAEVDQIIERYRPQLQAYRRAASAMFSVDPGIVTTRLVLLEHGRVVAV